MTSNTPLPTNSQASNANAFIKKIEGILLPIAQNAIIAACPDLGAPVVKQITEAIESDLANALTKMIETGVTFLIIDNQTNNEDGSLSAAQTELINAEKSGDQNAIEKAEQDYANAQDDLVSDDGSATPQ